MTSCGSRKPRVYQRKSQPAPRSGWWIVLLIAGSCLFQTPCAAGEFKSALTVPPDTFPGKQPRPLNPDHIGDGLNRLLTKSFVRTFDAARYVRMAAHKPIEAANVNAYDEVPNSSWYTARISERAMSATELMNGPDTLPGPDTSGLWTIIKGKSRGAIPGFVIKDRRNDVYLLKLEYPGYPELLSGAEVICTKILYAAGYNVPANYISVFDPKRVRIKPNITFTDNRKRTMPFTEVELNGLLSTQDPLPGGKIRIMASKWIKGKALGGWAFTGTRSDDPNDRIPHERRRELRGLRVIGAWLNYFDLNRGNMLDVYDTGARYVRHYLLDFHNTLGSSTNGPLDPTEGMEPYFNMTHFLRNIVSIGFYKAPWEKIDSMPFRSAGNWYSNWFHPNEYQPLLPTRPFEDMTDRDAFWGAKIVCSFTDNQIDAIVRTAQYSDHAAQAYVARVLKERRDIIGRYYFSKVSPLDRFVLTGPTPGGDYRLRFNDCAVERGLVSSSERTYQFSLSARPGNRMTQEPAIALSSKEIQGTGDRTVTLRIRASRIGSKGWCRAVRLNFKIAQDGVDYIASITR
jgi:hypothetical protein